MRKPILLFAVFLFFSSCNNKATEPKPDAVRVIKDTFAQNIMRPFNTMPVAEKIYVKVEPKEDIFLRKQDAALQQLLTGMKTRPQHFTINAARPSEVQGEQGTTLAFSPNCFVGKNGDEIVAPVDIELKEFYSLEQMLLENLASPGGAFESKGMICVNATCAGKELRLKEGQLVSVKFPFRQKEGYKFFYGNPESEGVMNWLPAARTPEQKFLTPGEFTRPEFSRIGLDLKNYLHETLDYPEEAKRNELSANVGVSFLIDENGKVSEVNTRESYKIFRNEIARVLGNMPAWKPATYAGKNIPAMVHVDIDFNIRRFDQVKIEFNETEVALVNSAGNTYMEYGGDLKNAEQKNARQQSLSRLGWYNCARSLDLPGKMADVIVRSDAKSDVKLILKNHNSISCGENCVGYSRFRNLPVDAEVYIMAIRYEKGRVQYALQPLKLGKQNIVSLAWKNGNEAAIQKTYHRLTAKS